LLSQSASLAFRLGLIFLVSDRHRINGFWPLFSVAFGTGARLL
jgi:hypothetical protein